jgi:energy-coupling factor transporter transmembrane protein EcfT
VLIGTLRMSDQLTLALAARGLETTRQRTTWRDLQMTRRDWIALVSITIVGGLLAWRRYG